MCSTGKWKTGILVIGDGLPNVRELLIMRILLGKYLLMLYLCQ